MKLVQSVTCVRVTLSVFLLLLGFARSFRLPCSPFTSNKNPLTSSFARRINLRPSLALNQRDARHRVSLRSGNARDACFLPCGSELQPNNFVHQENGNEVGRAGERCRERTILLADMHYAERARCPRQEMEEHTSSP